MVKTNKKKYKDFVQKHPAFKMSSAQIIPISFMCLILCGALLLWLPISSAPGVHTDFLTALFTSTTSVCVTGSVVVPTFSHWSLFGKIVILILIQFGGLGIVAVLGLAVFLARQQFSLSGSLLLKDAYNLNSAKSISGFLGRVFIGTLLVEFIGAFGFMPAFIKHYGPLRGVWYSFFTSVSAFCNAGIDICGPDSLIQYRGNPMVLIVTMALIILGGIGYVVWFDILALRNKDYFWRGRFLITIKRLTEHTRLVLMLTFLYIVLGALFVFIFEYNNPGTLGGMHPAGKVLNSFFESVTFRTAGFATFPQENMKETTAIIGIVLMFIGGSPVGTAGGVKTITVFILILNVMAFIKGKDQVTILNRRIPNEVIRKAIAIITVHFAIAFVLCICLMAAMDLPFVDSMFEIMSAVSTVGLSRAITPELNNMGKWIVIIAMYLGRIGPISMLLFFQTGSTGGTGVKYADGRFIVG